MRINLGKDYKRTLGLKNILYRVVWNIAYIFLFRIWPSILFNKWRIIILRTFGAKIGKESVVYHNAKIWLPYNLRMGEKSCIGPNVNCYNVGLVEIGNCVTISQGAYICTPTHNYTTKDFEMIPSKIIIKDYAWITTEAFIGPKVIIGEGAVVGARAAVFKNIEAWSIVGGNPAKFIKKRILN